MRTKTDREVSLLRTFLQKNVELRDVEKIPPAQLRTVPTKYKGSCTRLGPCGKIDLCKGY